MDKNSIKMEINAKLKIFYSVLHKLKSRKTVNKIDLFIICTLDRICDSVMSVIFLTEKGLHLDAACICRIILEHIFLLGATISVKNKKTFLKSLDKSYMRDRLKLNKISFLTGNYLAHETQYDFKRRIEFIVNNIQKNTTNDISGYEELSDLAFMTNVYVMYYSYLSAKLHANSRSIQEKVSLKDKNTIKWKRNSSDSEEMIDEMVFNFLKIINSILKMKFDNSISEVDYNELINNFKRETVGIEKNKFIWDKFYGKLISSRTNKTRATKQCAQR
jgi:hypothetical protein